VAIVLDGSVAIGWCLRDDESPLARVFLERVKRDGALVPAIFRLEVANGLLIAVRRGRITDDLREEDLAELSNLPIQTDLETDRHAWLTTSELAKRFRLTAYDAAYLELARRSGYPLASFDRQLLQAASSLGLTLLGDT
jgi:predicted nucleic acid-binding protein